MHLLPPASGRLPAALRLRVRRDLFLPPLRPAPAGRDFRSSFTVLSRMGES
ncbi:MAG: hypothetical protein IT349_14820 [Candidatus Eisenbacteria bacterium]|nr:hypothetical protein [Candidatus Eisenbacteria bacterium]MCC7143369.1 hypothetical protein [Candidatus Eisenbacteria bacterium]